MLRALPRADAASAACPFALESMSTGGVRVRFAARSAVVPCPRCTGHASRPAAKMPGSRSLAQTPTTGASFGGLQSSCLRDAMKTSEEPKAVQEKGAFRMSCAVECRIDASPERLWTLLTNAADFPRWNSTVSKLEGSIKLGEKLALQVPAAPGRTFKPKVTELEPNRSMVWSDGFAPMFKGVRSFTLTPNADGSTSFNMTEVFSGLMLPMIRGSLPDFGPSFEAYAADLKREAEGKA
jgi:hypothetical protein